MSKLLNSHKNITQYFSNLSAKAALKKKRVYLLPTRKGALILLNFFILFNIGNIYGSNFVLLFSFILISLLVVYMIQTSIALSNVKFNGLKIDNIFAHEQSSLQINFEGSLEENAELTFDYKTSLSIHSAEIDNNQKIINLTLKGNKRGFYKVSTLKIKYLHPSTLFYSWTYQLFPNEFYIYPEKIKSNKKISEYLSNFSHQLSSIHNEELIDFKELLDIQQGDKINWKLFAKTNKYFIPLYSEMKEEDIVINESDFQQEREDMLKIITGLSVVYFRSNIKFSVIIDRKNFLSIQNKKQLDELLEYLACC